MLQFEYHQSRAPLVIATVVALICHALFMVFALPVVLRVEPDDYKKPAKKTENQEMRVVVRSVPAKELPEKVEVPLDMKEFFSQTDDIPEEQKPPEEDLEKLEEIEIDIEIEAEIAAHTSAHRLASTLDLSPLFAALALFSLVSAYVWNGLFVWRRDPVAPHRFPIKKVRSSS